MGNEFLKKDKKQKKKPPTVMEIKSYIMAAQCKMTLYRNKKVNIIRQKRKEIANYLRENNLDVAKAKMDTVIRDEDTITVYDILGPICEILKERVTYLMSSNEPPADIRAHLDTIVYSAGRLEVEELHKLKELLRMKYGELYVNKANANTDSLVNVNVIEKLKVKPVTDAFITIRLKQLCKEEKVNFEFPCEIVPEQCTPSLDGGQVYNSMDNPNVNYNPYDSQEEQFQGQNQWIPPGKGQWNPPGQGNFGNNNFSNPFGGNEFSNSFSNNNNNQNNQYQNPGEFGGQNNNGGFNDYYNQMKQSSFNPYANQGNQGCSQMKQSNFNPYDNQGNQRNQMKQSSFNPYANQGNQRSQMKQSNLNPYANQGNNASQFGGMKSQMKNNDFPGEQGAFNPNKISSNPSSFNPNNISNNQSGFNPYEDNLVSDNDFPKANEQNNDNNFPGKGIDYFPKNPSQVGVNDFPKNPSQMGPSDFPKNPSQMGPSDFPKNPSQMGPSDFPKNPSQMGPSDFPKNPSQMGPSDFPKNPSQMGPIDFPKNPGEVKDPFQKQNQELQKSFKNEPIDELDDINPYASQDKFDMPSQSQIGNDNNQMDMQFNPYEYESDKGIGKSNFMTAKGDDNDHLPSLNSQIHSDEKKE